MELLPLSMPFRLAEFGRKRKLPFRLAPDAPTRAKLAVLLGTEAFPALVFEGTLSPAGRDDVLLEARLGATVVQPCVVTLAPVTTKIDEIVVRRYLADFAEPAGEEVEMSEDDTAEPLPQVLDVAEVMAEALALALPLYPRAAGVAPAEPAAGDGTGETHRPFAGLGGLIARRDGGPDGGENSDGG